MMKFELSEQMVAIIGNALGAQPYNIVKSTIEELQKQINAQQNVVPQQSFTQAAAEEPAPGA